MTESIASPVVRCTRCGKEARGGVLINGLGACHVRESDRELLESMIVGAPEPAPELPTLVACDPFSPWPGITPGAARVLTGLARLRQKYLRVWSDPEIQRKYRQASPESIAEAAAEGLIPGEREPRRWGLEPPSIPPPPGMPDPVLEPPGPGELHPIRSRMGLERS